MWYQLKITGCPSFEVERLCDELQEGKVLAITLTDKEDCPVLEPAPGTAPLWPEVVINALYDNEEDAIQVKKGLSGQKNLSFDVHYLPEEDWQNRCRDNFKPQCFGGNLWVCPSWMSAPKPDAVNIILDPGLAFGTGTHPTTGLCLTWLAGANLKSKLVIDYGCGSGILSLAAIKLGALRVQAVDIDEQALISTRNNGDLNAISHQDLVTCFPPALQYPVDLVIANILLLPVLNLQERFKTLLKPQGILVVSGILDEQKEELIEAYQAKFILQSSHNKDGWSLLVFTNLSSEFNL